MLLNLNFVENIFQSKSIKVLGPEYNWLIDVRNYHQDTERLLSTFMEPGDNIALITSVQTVFSANDLVLKCGSVTPRQFIQKQVTLG